jgi:hypothetical protein
VKRLVCFAVLALVGQLALAQTQGATHDAKNLIGTWVGDWSSSRSGGRFEFEITAFDGESMTGRVNSEAQACTIGWTALSGRLVADEIHGTYTIGRPCSRVQVVFPFPKGNVIEGTWKSEYPGYGTFRLVRKDAP